MDKSKLLRIAASVLISIVLWVYVINEVNPDAKITLRNIPVMLTGTDTLAENNLAIDGSGEYTVDITVKASRSDLGTISADNFIVTADVSGLSLGQDYITVNVKAPTGYVVENISSRKIQVYVDELMTKTIPAELRITSAESGFETCILSIEPEEILISGAQNLVAKAEKLVIELDSKQLAYEMPRDFALVGNIIDAHENVISGLSASYDSIAVSAVIYQTKTVNFNPSVSGSIWKGALVELKQVPATLDIKGPSDILSEISELSCKTVSIDGVFEDVSIPLSVNLPDGVYLCDRNSDPRLTLDIADTGSISFDYTAEDIAAAGLSDNLSMLISTDKTISVNISGAVSTLKALSRDDISLSVNVENLKEGSYELALELSCRISGLELKSSVSELSITLSR